MAELPPATRTSAYCPGVKRIGGSSVTTSTGLPLFKLERLTIDLQPGEQLFAISSDSGHTVAWLRQVL